jgi:hypothetical protein
MYLALATASQQALWVLLGKDSEVLDFRSSLQEDQIQMSTQLGNLLDDLLISNRINLDSIEGLGVVVGPGAFTGLRMGVSFAEGLCMAQSIPKLAIPSFFLVNRPFIFPLRHTKAPDLSVEQYIAEGFESLLLKDSKTFEVVTIVPPSIEHRGFKGSYPWPSPQDLASAFKLSANNKVVRFEIEYGLDPKIFGQRRSL